MTWEDVKTKYGQEKVKFDSYYKYTFLFKNDKGFRVHCGGVADDIYRFEVVADKEYFIDLLEPRWITLNGETIFEEGQQ